MEDRHQDGGTDHEGRHQDAHCQTVDHRLEPSQWFVQLAWANRHRDLAAVDLAAPRNADRLRQTRDLVKAFRSIGERAMRRQCLNMLRTLARQRGRAASDKEERR